MAHETTEHAKGPIVGIDLGTTNSLVALCDARGPRILPDAKGRALVPSVVRYGADGVVVGVEAKERASEFSRTTIASVKRLMGRSVKDVGADVPYLSYEVVAGERDTARVRLPDGRVLSPEEVSAEVLRELKAQASRELGVEVTRAVVTVPAYFDDAQRQATRTAGRLAGLEVVRVVPEPTAAALAYGLGLQGTGLREKQGPSVVAVYDFGGGTFDVSVLRLTPAAEAGETSFFQVIATSGDTRLGGDDVDHALVGLFVREIAQRHQDAEGTDFAASLSAGVRRALLAEAERVKIALSDDERATARVALDGGEVYERVVLRSELEAVLGPLIERTLKCCKRVMADAAAGLNGEAIGAVVMVGGSTRIPLVRARVREFFGLEPYTALNPDHVVALGASVQAAVLDGVRKGTLLLDVIPLSLGIETVGGAVAKLIVRNSTVPARASEMFSTSVDNQTSIRLTVYQGEREMAADCRKLAEFSLRGIPPMPAGIPQLEVQFLLDASGVLSVQAHERRSGKRAQLQVVPNHGLTNDEVEKIERESLVHAREDMVRHRMADLIVNSKLDLKWIGERLTKHGAELEPEYRAQLQGQVDALRAMVVAAEKDWRSVNGNAFHAAKEALDRGSIRLQEVSIAASLRGVERA
jgi:molecular chaperone DnaK (HSP70)